MSGCIYIYIWDYIYVYIIGDHPLCGPHFGHVLGYPRMEISFVFLWEWSSAHGGCLAWFAFGGFANKKGEFIQKHCSSKRSSLPNHSCCVNPFCSSPPVWSLLNRSLLNQFPCITPSASRPLLSTTHTTCTGCCDRIRTRNFHAKKKVLQ